MGRVWAKMKYRINKFLALAGVASRRQAERLIEEGRVSVNGSIVTDLATQVDSQTDRVFCDAEEVRLKHKWVYLAVNKPVGYICTESDPQGRPLASELLPPMESRLFSIGRLDVDTEGLLCFTNDGQLAHRMSHPKYQLNKEYLVLLNKALDHEALQAIHSQSYELEDGPAPSVSITQRDNVGLLWTIEIKEGRNRIVRRIFETLGYTVRSLKRVKIGPIKLAELPLGKYRYLTQEEIKSLRKRLLE